MNGPTRNVKSDSCSEDSESQKDPKLTTTSSIVFSELVWVESLWKRLTWRPITQLNLQSTTMSLASNEASKVAAGLLAFFATPLTILAVLSLLGFTPAGILAGSLAASWMAKGMGVTPPLVPSFQSAGTTGTVGNVTQWALRVAAFWAAYKAVGTWSGGVRRLA
jgi:hypothetical protein